MARRPMLYLLSGLPCSGKSTYAAGLESQGVERVNVDQMMISTVGRMDVDYPASDHLDLLQPVFHRALVEIRHHLVAGHDVVLDHGLGRRDERNRLKRLASRCDADWTLLRFDVDMETVRARCAERRNRDDAVPITDETLDFLATTFEPPMDEGEVVVAN